MKFLITKINIDGLLALYINYLLTIINIGDILVQTIEIRNAKHLAQ